MPYALLDDDATTDPTALGAALDSLSIAIEAARDARTCLVVTHDPEDVAVGAFLRIARDAIAIAGEAAGVPMVSAPAH